MQTDTRSIPVAKGKEQYAGGIGLNDYIIFSVAMQ